MVVKPAPPATPGGSQPGLKVRGREYLRIIYGPDYTDSLDLLRQRQLGAKRRLAQREHGLGLDALAAFVAGEPLVAGPPVRVRGAGPGVGAGRPAAVTGRDR